MSDSLSWTLIETREGLDRREQVWHAVDYWLEVYCEPDGHQYIKDQPGKRVKRTDTLQIFALPYKVELREPDGYSFVGEWDGHRDEERPDTDGPESPFEVWPPVPISYRGNPVQFGELLRRVYDWDREIRGHDRRQYYFLPPLRDSRKLEGEGTALEAIPSLVEPREGRDFYLVPLWSHVS